MVPSQILMKIEVNAAKLFRKHSTTKVQHNMTPHKFFVNINAYSLMKILLQNFN